MQEVFNFPSAFYRVKVTVNLEPLPTSLSTLIHQPAFLHSFLTTDSPSPKPPPLPLCDLSTVKNRSKMRSKFSLAMPMPVSATENSVLESATVSVATAVEESHKSTLHSLRSFDFAQDDRKK